MIGSFEHIEHEIAVPALRDGCDPDRRQVLIAGGGPVGFALALALARHGVRSLVIEADRTVCIGSRAICLSRRSLEIFDRLGVLSALLAKGLPWTGGRSFYRNTEVLHFRMPHDEDQRLHPMTNLQQYHMEQMLLDGIAQYPDLIEVRWGTRADSVAADADGVRARLETDSCSYTVEADWLVACDGARSRVRQELNLPMSGTAYEGRYVIVDIEMEADLPVERLAWFDPPSNPGRTMLMHQQPDRMWRLDYQLHPGEDAAEALRPENVHKVVEAHLNMVGIDKPWRPIWSSMYRASALSLERYRHGRILFAGDAAHLVPIFGVRGLNSGFEDAFNLGWKLALVCRGKAHESLLDSYSQERRQAWEVNVASAMKSTEFMAPPSRGFEVMRQAVLSLAKQRPALTSLINPRQSSAIRYVDSPLSTMTDGEAGFAAGPAVGSVLAECPIQHAGQPAYLTGLLPDTFAAIYCSDGGAVPAALLDCAATAEAEGIALSLIAVRSAGSAVTTPPQVIDIVDDRERFEALYDASPGTLYLVRPDGHVCARWRQFGATDIVGALRRAAGQYESVRVLA